MFQGNWKCSTCGGAITELPFQPRSEAGLTCRTCFMKNKGGGGQSSAPAPEPDIPSAGEAPDIPEEAGFANEAPDMPDLDGAAPTTPGADKPKFAGDWKCATCGGAITSLPFEPRDVTNLKCIDCFKASKA